MANALAYYNTTIFTAIKSFREKAQEMLKFWHYLIFGAISDANVKKCLQPQYTNVRM